MVGILDGHLWIWIVLIILYSVLCIFLAVKIYFINESRRGLAMILETKTNGGWIQALTPLRKGKHYFIEDLQMRDSIGQTYFQHGVAIWQLQ